MKYATQHEAGVFFERARNHIKYVLGNEAVVNGEVNNFNNRVLDLF